MFTRIGSVIICILTAVWLAREPDWEPMIALAAALIAYAGIEFSQHREAKEKNRKNGELLDERNGLIEKVGLQGILIQSHQKQEDQRAAERNARLQKALDKIRSK